MTQVPDNAPQGLDTPLPDPPSLDWDLLGNLVPIDPSESSTNDVGAPTDMEAEPPAKELSGESTAEDPAPEAITQQDHTEARPKEITTWHDVALSIAAEFMMQMRMEVKGQLGYTTSAVRFLHVSTNDGTMGSWIELGARVLQGIKCWPR